MADYWYVDVYRYYTDSSYARPRKIVDKLKLDWLDAGSMYCSPEVVFFNKEQLQERSGWIEEEVRLLFFDRRVPTLYNLDGKVLLIGVDYDKNTSIHLADVRAEYPGKHTCVEHSAVMENGKRVWKRYETLFVDGKDFIDIGTAFEAVHTVVRTKLGGAELKIMKQRELVDFATLWIEKNRQ